MPRVPASSVSAIRRLFALRASTSTCRRGCIEGRKARDMLAKPILSEHVAAVSAGIFRGMAVLDLDYAEDVEAHTDANFVMTGSGGIVEIQGTAEGAPFSEAEFATLFD